jgi:hypothetical protein
MLPPTKSRQSLLPGKLSSGGAAREAFEDFVENDYFDYIDKTFEAIHTEDTGFVVSQLIDGKLK